MKKIIYTLLSVLILSISSYQVLASGGETELETTEEPTVTIEDNVTTVSSKYFDLILTRNSQLPFGKKVPYDIQITSHIDSPKTQILWEVPSTIKVDPKHDEFINFSKNETKTFKATITPERKGTYVVGVNVNSWQHDTNYTNSVKDTVEFDDNLVLQPVSTAYKVGNMLKIFLILIVSIGLLIAGYVFSKKGTKRLKKWLTPPQ